MTSSPDSPPERPERSEQYVKNPYAVSPHVGALSGEGSAADHIELPHTSRMAIVAMTLASCSVFGLLFIPLGLLGTVGMVLGFKARRRIHEYPQLVGDGLALAAVITGGAMTIVVGLFYVLYIGFYGIPFLG